MTTVTAKQYAASINLPEWVEQWDEITDLTGKTFEDVSLEIASLLVPAEVVTKPTKIKAKTLPLPTPAAGSLESIIAAAVAPYMAQNNAIDEDAVIELIKQYAPVKHIEVKSNAGTNIVTDAQHQCFEDILFLLGCRKNLYIYGPAGSGKTQAAENAALALGLQFTCVSVCAQSTKSDLLGFIDANGNYIPTLFRKAYEAGGVFLLDEVDNGNANILNVLNSALANGYCAFPDGMIKRHAEFRCIAAANTFGTGATRLYVGRNQLDIAFLTRFIPIEIDYDEKLEVSLYGSIAKKVQAIRKDYKGTACIISMRHIGNVVDLINAGWSEEKSLKYAVYNTIAPNILKK